MKEQTGSKGNKIEKTQTQEPWVKWTPGEDAQLLQEVADGKTIAEIAMIHDRTVGGITSRIGRHKLLNTPNTSITSLTETARLRREIEVWKGMYHELFERLEK